MAYHINEELGDIYYEVIGDQLILKIRDGILGRGCDIYIIKEDDATVPSDDTVFSSKRTIQEIENRIPEAGEGGYWEMKEDSSGNKYIYTKYPMATQYGATFYAGTPIEVGSIYDGLPIDNDTIYWQEYENGVKILKAKGGGEGGTFDSAEMWRLLGANTTEQINYSHISTAFESFKNEFKNTFVTVGEPEQEISRVKHFLQGLSIGENKHKIYEQDGVVYLDGDFVVTGGITQYGTGGRDVSTIMDGVVVDGTTIIKENNILKVIGGGSSFDEDAMWDALGSEGTEQINKSHLSTALVGYATTTALSDLTSLVNKKWTQDDEKIKNWDTAFSWGNHTEAGYAHLANEETFTGLKHFTAGLSVGAGKHKLYEKDGVVYFDGDLAVTGGITQYATDGVSVSTIMDGVVTDNVTIKKENGKLIVIGGSGSSFDKTAMWAALSATTNEQINHSHLTTALQGYATEDWVTEKNYAVKATTLAGYGITDAYTKTESDSKYPTKTGGGASGTWGINISGTAANANKVDNVSNGDLTSRYWNPTSLLDDLNNYRHNSFAAWNTVSANKPCEYGTLFQFSNQDNPIAGTNNHWVNQIAFGTNNRIYTRQRINTGVWSSWSSLAYLSDNVYSATKLQTPRTIWGNNFDGTANVSGDLSSVNRIYASGAIQAAQFIGNVTYTTGASPSNFFNDSSAIFDFIQKYPGVNLGTVQPILRWGNVINATGYQTRYIIGSARTEVDFGRIFMAVSNNDAGTSRGCSLSIYGGGLVEVVGNFLATGGITQYSDQRAKTIIEQITLSLQSIANSPVVRFRWNGWKQQDDGKTHIGGIAQYIQNILPEVIYNSEGVLTMDYATTGYIFAVQTAKHLLSYETKTDKEIRKLKKEVVSLKNKIKAYEKGNSMAN